MPAASLRSVMQALPADTPVHIHISEQQREVDDALAFAARDPSIICWTPQLALDRRWCLVHATHATAGELLAVRNSGAIVGLCPTTEANLGDGSFPLTRMTSCAQAAGSALARTARCRSIRARNCAPLSMHCECRSSSAV